MFGKGEDKSQEFDKVQTIIGPSIAVKGDFEGMGDVVVEGRLSGTLKTKRDLRVGPQAVIEADVEAENIYIAGEVKGTIKARETIEMGENSKVTGDIETRSIMIERGAIFNGNCSMSDVGSQMSEVGNQKSETGKKKEKKDKKDDEAGTVEELYGEDVK